MTREDFKPKMSAMKKIRLRIIGGNLLGACLSFFYFAHVEAGSVRGGPAAFYYLYFSIAMVLLFLIATTMTSRWLRPLANIVEATQSLVHLDEESAIEVRKKALNLAPFMSGTTLTVWVLAGFLFGFVQPAILQSLFGLPELSISSGLRMFVGITFVGGSVTMLFSFFATESLWRKQLHHFFPKGDLSRTRGTFRLSVRTRLVIVFLIISLVPLTVLGVDSFAKYTRASALISAGTILTQVSASSPLFDKFCSILGESYL
jgi:hypothetical protein